MENTLVVYGTLMPGEQNHSILSGIPGRWERVIINAKRSIVLYGSTEYPAIELEEPMEYISAYALQSHFSEENWLMLDEFEGPAYERNIIDYTNSKGETNKGFVYTKK